MRLRKRFESKHDKQSMLFLRLINTASVCTFDDERLIRSTPGGRCLLGDHKQSAAAPRTSDGYSRSPRTPSGRRAKSSDAHVDASAAINGFCEDGRRSFWPQRPKMPSFYVEGSDLNWTEFFDRTGVSHARDRCSSGDRESCKPENT